MNQLPIAYLLFKLFSPLLHRGEMRRRMGGLGIGLLAAGLSGSPVLADDTEVFQAHLSVAAATTLKPNVLFVIDTSGSMSSGVTGQKPFDPGKAETFYDGGTGTCLHTRVYWSTDGSAPDCTTAQYFEKSKLRCDAALDQVNQGGGGVYQDRLARYQTSPTDWRQLGTTAATQDPPHVECKADRGTHGETTASTDTYIVTGTTVAYQASPTGETNWEATGDFYTLFSGKYMNYVQNGAAADPGTPTRLDVVQAATNQIIAANHRNILAGLMRFDTAENCTSFFFGFCVATVSGNKGGPVTFAIKDISTSTARTSFQAAVNALTAEGFTPLAETRYEATLYYRGDAPLFGSNPPTPNDIQSVADSMSGGTYISPMTLECQKNHVVFLTDGDPTHDGDADAPINTLLAGAGANISDSSCDHVGFDGGDNCLDEIAEFLSEEDHSNLAGDQHVSVYTIGFLTDQTLLASAASKGNGQYFMASNALELSDAFQVILTDIQEQTSTFSAPAVSVNAFNRITNRDELFFSLFTPSNRVHWPGNIKRYQLDCLTEDTGNPGFCTDGDSDGFPDSPVIVDDNGNAAVDTATGFFKSTARSVWTDTSLGADGQETELGGAASNFGGIPGADDPPSPTQVVYTYTGTYVEDATYNGLFTPPGTDGVLSASANLVVPTNTALTAEVDLLPGPPDGQLESFFFPKGRDASDPTLANLINWSKGIDILDADEDGSTTDARHQVGDALHSKPLLVTYGSSDTNPDITLYTVNNDGVLHAIDIDDGTEVFTFIPQEMLSQVPEIFLDQTTSSGKSYALDGPLTVWFNDKDADGILDASSPDFETVYLFFGQRRGGNRYWALDVTDRSNPKLLWKIEGGVTGTAYQELGQSWSAMQPTKVKVNGTVKNVVVFGAGYDANQDNVSTPTDDTIGRGLFIVNAENGELIWHARTDATPAPVPSPHLTFSEMTNSIPSDVNVFDLTGDGLADRMYVGDTRAQLWRFDINNENTGASNMVIGARIAELQKTTAAATPGAADTRRFFSRPDVTLAAPEDAQPYLAITIGTGYRAHPLNKIVEDRFYMICDAAIANITDVSNYPSAITEEDLANITTNLLPTTTQLVGTPASPLVGWLLDLKDETTDTFVGEKALADSAVFNNVVLFTTFTPPTTPLTADCVPNQGNGRVYAVNLFDGSPIKDLDQVGGPTYTRSDRHLDLLRSGIPPNVVILFSQMNGVVPVGFVATEQIEMDFSDAPVKTYWFQQEVQ